MELKTSFSSFLHVAFLRHSDIIFLAIIKQMFRSGPLDWQPALLGKNKINYTLYKNYRGSMPADCPKFSFFISIFYCQTPPNIQKHLDTNILQSKLDPVFWVNNNRNFKDRGRLYSSWNSILREDANKKIILEKFWMSYFTLCW